MATPRSQQLANMASGMPRQNEEIAKKQRAATDMAIQQFVAQQPQGGNITQTAQAGAAQAVTAAAQPQLAAQKKNIQQQTQMAQLQLQQKQADNKRAEMKDRITKLRNQTEFQDLLANIDNKAKNALVDAQMQFQSDSFGRTRYTEQQLMDFAVLQAKDETELQKYADDVRRATENELYMINKGVEVLQQEIKNQLELEHTERDHKYLADLQKKKYALEEKMRKKQAARANRAGMAGAVFGAAGAVVGAYFGGPTGALAGYQGGQGLGMAAQAGADRNTNA